HVDDAGVLADADEQRLALRQVAEPPEVHLGGLVRAVLAPHDAVHGQLGGGGPAAEDVADAQVLVVLEPQLAERLLLLRRRRRPLDGVELAHAATTADSTLVKKPSPSVEG